MRVRLRAVLILLPITFIHVVAAAQSTPPDADEARREWERLQQRFGKQESYNLLTEALWTVTHAGESRKEVEEVVNLLSTLANSFQKQDPALLKEIGGPTGFKEKM